MFHLIKNQIKSPFQEEKKKEIIALLLILKKMP